MPIKYTKLFHLLLDRNIRKGELQEMAQITNSIVARLGNNETVRTDTIGKICKALKCQPGDIMEYVDDEPVKESVLGQLKKAFNAGMKYEATISEEKFEKHKHTAGGPAGDPDTWKDAVNILKNQNNEDYLNHKDDNRKQQDD